MWSSVSFWEASSTTLPNATYALGLAFVSLVQSVYKMTKIWKLEIRPPFLSGVLGGPKSGEIWIQLLKFGEGFDDGLS